MTSAATDWFVTTVKPQHESAVVQMLDARGLEPFAPTYQVVRRWSDRKKTLSLPLFPGYVFCRSGLSDRATVLKTPGVTSIVGFGGVPASVPDTEMDRIRTMVSSGMPVQPWPFLRSGHRVRIEEGPLKGVEGLVVQVKTDLRLVVSITLLQRSVSVSIDRDQVTPTSGK